MRSSGAPASISQYHTANATTVLTQISIASTNTDKADALLSERVLTKKNSRNTREVVTTPSSTKEIVRAKR